MPSGHVFRRYAAPTMFSSRVPSDLSPTPFAIALARLRATRSPVFNLTESNPTRVGLDYPASLLDRLADPQVLAYTPDPLGMPVAREAVAGDFARRGLEVTSERVVLTASTSEAYSVLFKLLCDPGDRVLVPRPSYPLFEHLTRLDAIIADPYDLDPHGAWEIDVAGVARAVTPRTRAVLVVSPNNPTGSFVRADELEQVVAICHANALALIGDEVFADYVLPGGTAGPSVIAQNRVLTFSLGGLSKTVGLPQMKLAWMAVGGPRGLVEPAQERLAMICDSYLSVATPVQVAAPLLLDAGAAVRQQIASRVGENYRRLVRAVLSYPACRALPAAGGWYAIVQVPATQSEEAVALELLERDDVVVHPGYFFDFPREAYFVISLLPPPDIFSEAIGRLFERVSNR